MKHSVANIRESDQVLSQMLTDPDNNIPGIILTNISRIVKSHANACIFYSGTLRAG